MMAPASDRRSNRFAGPQSGARGFVATGLAACLLLALALRLHGLALPSPWVDEIASRTFARLAWSDLFGPVAEVETNPPGYYALLKLVIGVAGQSEMAMRLPSAIAGALAVVPVAFVGQRAGGPLGGLFAGALVAVSTLQIHHSQEARGYALLFLALATALWLVGPMLDGRASMRRKLAATLGFVLACLAALYLHATATIMVAAIHVHALVVLAAGGGSWRRELALLSGAGLAIMIGDLWWLRLAAAMAADPTSPVAWIERPDFAASAAIMGDVLGGFHLGRLKPLAAGMMLVALLLGAWLGWRRRHAEAMGLAAGLVVGLMALHGLSQFAPMMLQRTALALLVFAAPLAGFGVAALRPRALGLVLATLLLALSLRGALSHATAMAREGFGEDWRGAVAALTARAAPGDIVLLGSASQLGALPLLAPQAAAGLAQRVVRDPANRLDAALVAATGLGAWFDTGEACGRTVWTIGRDIEMRDQIEPLALPPPSFDEEFGRVILRRVPMPTCED
jgi:mannosyltransferase